MVSTETTILYRSYIISLIGFKIADYFFVVRDYDSTQYEALYLNGEWYNSLYEMPHPYYAD